ncbi:hypothetical protein D9756_011191 [Leucocoprinus leucothites]|uniref:CxC2-like cysteine cluster KDZ transposase-associated domain-containing protein n=1 Tax=Leucocoprinus leucothites TaxID=201217 RepID=A0A8H5CP75_9AGAR|nr:hypothetical protein D9756_011191 [Leucoagaricus leucothites]
MVNRKKVPSGIINVDKRRPSKKAKYESDVQTLQGHMNPNPDEEVGGSKSVTIEEIEDGEEAEGIEEENERVRESQESQKSTKKQGMSARMEAFTPRVLKMIQDEVLGIEYDSGFAPHAFSSWTGSHFEKSSLHDLGFTIHLGHHGQPCPAGGGAVVDSVVVHTNGVHERRIAFCLCSPSDPSYDHLLQLVRNRLFPPTADSPRTAFTFEVLEDFHRHSLSSKSSAYDYYNALKMHTNAAFPYLVEDRYSSMMVVMRLWRHLSLRRWAGLEHDIDQVLAHRRKNSLAVYCPACPEIGLNVDENVVRLAYETEMHLYTLFLSLDGNYRLQRKRKNNDPHDSALNAGHAYFVESNAFKQHMMQVEKEKEETTCVKLKAVDQQDRVKFKDAVVSGVMGCQCARHLIWLAQGMVDLDKGEAYARTDYALAHALGMEALRHRWIMLSYDIWCQYHINLPKRFSVNFRYLEKTVTEMRGAVPKMHIHGHNWECQIEHSFFYKPYSGMTCGEGIESTWSEQNHAASSTKELNEGHRHDTLDDFNGYWNWCKAVKIGLSLSAQAKRWHKELQDHQAAFDSFTAAVPQEVLAEWKTLTAAVKTNPALFELKDQGTSELKVYTELLGEEADKDFGVTKFILKGLELEDLLLDIRAGDDDDELLSSTFDALREWRLLQSELFPRLRPLPHIDEDDLEKTELCLPSSYTVQQREEFGLIEITKAEIKLRRGRAYDILRALREGIYRSEYIRITKKIGPIGKKLRSYTNSGYKAAEEQKVHLLSRYERTYQILKDLGATENLFPLTSQDLWVKNPFQLHKMKDSSKHNPWFWSIGKPEGLSTNAWMLEVERARWFRERALVDRLREELELLNEEFRRSCVTFKTMSSTWTKLAQRTSNKPGFSAYASRHAAMYSEMSRKVNEQWQDASQWLPFQNKGKEAGSSGLPQQDL